MGFTNTAFSRSRSAFGKVGPSDPIPALNPFGQWQTHDGNNIPVRMWQDVAMTTPAVSEGHPIAAWQAKNDPARVAIQSNASFQPSLTFRSGRPLVKFLEGDMLLDTSFSFNLAERTVTASWQEDTAFNYSGIVIFPPVSGADYNQNTACISICSDTNPSNASVILNGYNIVRVGGKPSPWSVTTDKFGSGTGDFYSNGSLVGSSSHASVGIATQGVIFGGRMVGAPGGNFEGVIGAIYIFPTKLSDPDRITEETYMASLFS